MPAASVGVKIPPRMPPRIITGAPNGGIARRSARRVAVQLYGSPTSSGLLLDHRKTVTTRARVMSKAGITAAANNAPVDTAATDAYTTAGMLGGMMGLIKAELALKPTENSAG